MDCDLQIIFLQVLSLKLSWRSWDCLAARWLKSIGLKFFQVFNEFIVSYLTQVVSFSLRYRTQSP